MLNLKLVQFHLTIESNKIKKQNKVTSNNGKKKSE